MNSEFKKKIIHDGTLGAQMSETKANISYRVDEARLKELRLAAVERDQSMQSMIDEALDKLLKSGQKRAGYSEHEEKLIGLVLEIMRKDPGAFESLRKILSGVVGVHERRGGGS